MEESQHPTRKHRRKDKRTKGDVAGALGRVEVGEVAQFEGRFADRVEDLRRRLARRSPARVDKFLQKDFAEDAVRLFLKDGGKDDGDAVGGGQQVDGLFGAVMDAHDFRPRVLRDTIAGLRLDLTLEVERALKGRRKGVALQERDGLDQVGLRLRVPDELRVLEVDLERDAVPRFGVGFGDEAVGVLAFEDLAGPVLGELGPARDVHRQQEVRLAGRGREVVPDRVKVDKGLVERGRALELFSNDLLEVVVGRLEFDAHRLSGFGG